MTTSATLRAIALTALAGSTTAGSNVFSPRDIPTWDGSYPMLIVTTDDEDGDSHGRNGPPQFTVTATLRVIARVEQAAEDDDLGATLVLAELETLRDQVKTAVINYPALMVELQQFSFFRARMRTTGKEDTALHQGEVVVEIGLEFYQGPEDFYQVAVSDSTPEFTANFSVPDGTTAPGLDITLSQ